jgi:hypothetical protein
MQKNFFSCLLYNKDFTFMLAQATCRYFLVDQIKSKVIKIECL